MSSNTLCLLFGLVCFQSQVAGQQLSIEDAVNNNWINYALTGINKAHVKSGFNNNYGQCIRLEVNNQSNKHLQLVLENGRNLIAQDDEVQNMVVTKGIIIQIAPGEKKRYRVYAMAAQKFKLAPTESNRFAFGSMVNNKLQKLTTYVELKKYQNLSGQQGVWVVADNQPLASITGGNTDVRNNMVAFATSVINDVEEYKESTKPSPVHNPMPHKTVNKTTGYTSKFGIYTEPGDLYLNFDDLKGNGYVEVYGAEQPTFSHSIKRINRELVLNGHIRFSVFGATNVTVALYNSSHQQQATFVNKMHNSGSYNYSFEAAGITNGKYYIKLFFNKELNGRHDVYVN